MFPAGSTTPPFLLWSLERACPVRQSDSGRDPERTERQLRAARAFGDAEREGRVIDGVALGRECFAAEPIAAATGFEVVATLAIYGGAALVRQACASCPANAGASAAENSVAGCFGLVPLPEAMRGPAWQRQWAASPLVGLQAEELRRQLNRLPAFAEGPQLIAAVTVAAEHALPLHVRFFPAGTIVGRRWIVPPHCARCGIERPPTGNLCPVCQAAGPPLAERRRHLRGDRPYYPLTKVVGPERAAELLRRATSVPRPRPQP